jgi:hypothetical protein
MTPKRRRNTTLSSHDNRKKDAQLLYSVELDSRSGHIGHSVGECAARGDSYGHCDYNKKTIREIEFK